MSDKNSCSRSYGKRKDLEDDMTYVEKMKSCNMRVGYLPLKEPAVYARYESVARFDVLQEVGHFSVDEDRVFFNDQSQMKYLHLPDNILKLNLDLNIGYENAVKRSVGDSEKLKFLLNWILYNKGRLLNAESNISPAVLKSMPLPLTFCCYRGLLTTLLATPYEKYDDWMICASKFKGTIYLCSFSTANKIRKEANKTERMKRMCSWGYKFEQYMTKSQPRGLPEPPDKPVNENTEFCAVFESKMNDDILLYAAEVDAVNTNTSSRNVFGHVEKYIELKTAAMITTEIQDINFCKYKMLKWWAQCCTAAVMKLHCGFRDDDGIVNYIRSFHLQEMMCVGQSLWSSNVCFNFVNEFLSFVKSVAVKDDPRVIYKFEWQPKGNIICTELHSSTAPEYQILPDWYTSQYV